MRRLWSSVLVGLLAVAWCALETPRLATAAVPCGAGGNYFDGYYQAGHPEWQFTGASSYIVVRDGALCPGVRGYGNFSNAWVMIAGSGPRDWAQVGFERTQGQPLRWFSQFSTFDSLDTWYSPYSVNNQAGVRHAFRVLYDPQTRRLNATIDTTTVARSAFDPKQEWGGQPWSPQFFAEAGYKETDVPGRSTTPTAYSSIGAQRLDNGSLILMPCILSGATDSSRWARSASSCNAFSVWTK